MCWLACYAPGAPEYEACEHEDSDDESCALPDPKPAQRDGDESHTLNGAWRRILDHHHDVLFGKTSLMLFIALFGGVIMLALLLLPLYFNIGPCGAPEWDALEDYDSGDIVLWHELSYIALASSTGQQPQLVSDYWLDISLLRHLATQAAQTPPKIVWEPRSASNE
jgi:hypothetical protein